MAKVKWLPDAVDDFERLYFFLLDKDSGAAENAAKNIIKGVYLLMVTPRIGKPMPDRDDRRELFLALGAGAYVIRYRLESTQSVVIIRIWHNRENRD
jgi:plasmid stabilization system protein ParE